jgi:hypothetical protein
LKFKLYKVGKIEAKSYVTILEEKNESVNAFSNPSPKLVRLPSDPEEAEKELKRNIEKREPAVYLILSSNLFNYKENKDRA